MASKKQNPKSRAKTTENTPVKVPFYGRHITCLRSIAGAGTEYEVQFRTTCEDFGLDYSTQLKRLKADPTATVVLRTTVGADGRLREMVFVDSRTFKVWLIGLDLTQIKVSAEVMAILVRLKLEAGIVVDRYFRGERFEFTAPPSDHADYERKIHELETRLAESDRKLARQVEILMAVQAELDVTNYKFATMAVESYERRKALDDYIEAVKRRDASPKVGDDFEPEAMHHYLTLREYLHTPAARKLPGLEAYRTGGLKLSGPSGQIAGKCRKRGRQIRSTKYKGSHVATYPMDIIHEWGRERNDVLKANHEMWVRATEGMEGVDDGDETINEISTWDGRL